MVNSSHPEQTSWLRRTECSSLMGRSYHHGFMAQISSIAFSSLFIPLIALDETGDNAAADSRRGIIPPLTPRKRAAIPHVQAFSAVTHTTSIQSTAVTFPYLLLRFSHVHLDPMHLQKYTRTDSGRISLRRKGGLILLVGAGKPEVHEVLAGSGWLYRRIAIPAVFAIGRKTPKYSITK